MRQLFYSAAFWVVVVIAIRLAVCFPKSLLARILFSRHGPVIARNESELDFAKRRARFHAGWTLQCAVLFALGVAAIARWPALADSLFVTVLFTAVIPALGLIACAATLAAAGRALWLHYLPRAKAPPQTQGSWPR